MTKAELLDIAYKHLPPKEYMADKAASKHNVQLVRIPVKHCLTRQWLSSVGPEHVKPYHVRKHEEIFKAADKIAEEMDNDLIDEDEGEDNTVD
ncbi:unnamed protein product, partial [Didymodactylos carnosus]